MDSKGQEALEYILTYGWALIVIVIVVGVLIFIVSTPSGNSNLKELAADNFCEAWAEERGFTYLDGQYESLLLSGRAIECKYSVDADVFDGGVSAGKSKYKYFDISEEALLEWADKSESKDCCEVCE